MNEKQKERLKKIGWNILKGVILIVIIWVINAFIAFIPFSRQSNTKHILLTWFLVDVALIAFLNKKKYFNKTVVISAIAFILLVIASYFIPLNNNIPQDALQLNAEISAKHEDKYDYAKELFYAVERKYDSPIRQYLLEPWKVFIIRDFAYFWNAEGEYVDSSIQGRMYRELLLQSGRFTEDEVLIHQSFCSNSPHLIIKIISPEREEPIWADLWAVDNFPRKGIEEKYEFGMRTKRPCDFLTGAPYE